jgi:hypothetical protein
MSAPLPPYYIKAVRQNGLNRDCTIATIATLAGVNYEEALAAAVLVQPAVLEVGMTWPEIRQTCEALGLDTTIKRRGAYDLDEDTGILNVKNRKEDHVVFLWAGRIVEGNFEQWLDPEEYLKHYRYRAASLLVRTA